MAWTLGLDVGTQGTKAIVVDVEDGRVVARASSSYGLLEHDESGRPLGEGAAEQHPDTWLAAIDAVLAALDVDLARVRAVAVSGQQHGFVPLDEDDRVLRAAKLWCDTATVAEAEHLERSWGRPLPVGYTASKILWLANHEPENWSRLARVCLPHDYINLVLTGRHATECGDASGTGLLDPETRAWDVKSASTIDAALPSKLPELVSAGAVFGKVHASAAARFGLSADCVVGVGGGDNMMAAIGAGAVEPGVVVMSLGTSGTVFACSEKPVVDPTGAIAPFCDSTGLWLPLLCIMNLTAVTEEVRHAFDMSHEEISALARAVPIGSDGLRMLPFLQGERVPPLPDATGSLDGMRTGWLDPGRLYRAALEACVCNLSTSSRRLEQFGVPLRRLRLVGGAASNPLWQSTIADAFELPVEVLDETEAAALGAALQAAWTLRRQEDPQARLADVVAPFVRPVEEITPDEANRGAWGDLRRSWSELLAARHGA